MTVQSHAIECGGSIIAPWTVTILPFTETRPAAMAVSIARREPSPSPGQEYVQSNSAEDVVSSMAASMRSIRSGIQALLRGTQFAGTRAGAASRKIDLYLRLRLE